MFTGTYYFPIVVVSTCIFVVIEPPYSETYYTYAY